MVYCNECVRVSYCFDMRKMSKEGIVCYKYKDSNYNDCSRDSDCDSVTEGAFGDSKGSFSGIGRNRKFRNVECLVSH